MSVVVKLFVKSVGTKLRLSFVSLVVSMEDWIFTGGGNEYFVFEGKLG